LILIRRLVQYLLISICLGVTSGACVEAGTEREFSERSGRLQGLYEPSGVQQLPDGRFLIVEDEAQRPFALLTFDRSGKPTIQRPSRTSASLADNPQLDDLEGIALGEQGYVYAITSHSLKRNGKRDPARERLVRLRVEGDRLLELAAKGGLREQITARLESLDRTGRNPSKRHSAGLNIEGLAFDPGHSRLMIGLRSPLVDGKAVIFAIESPAVAFTTGAKPRIEAVPFLLDLDGGGIRALAYDPRLQGFLIVSRADRGRHERKVKLWQWEGDQKIAPRRLPLDSGSRLEGAEGVCPARIEGIDQILIVRDNGIASQRKAAHFARLDYADLSLSLPSPEDHAP
jgi:hypothetical protein